MIKGYSRKKHRGVIDGKPCLVLKGFSFLGRSSLGGYLLRKFNAMGVSHF